MSQENVAPAPVAIEAQPPTPAETPADPAPAAENDAATVTTEKAIENADVIEEATPALEPSAPAPETVPVEAAESTAPTEAAEGTTPSKKSKPKKAVDKSKREENATEDAATSAADAATTNEPSADDVDQTMYESQATKTAILKGEKPNAPVINIVLDDNTIIRTSADGEIMDEFFIDGSFEDAKSFKSVKSINDRKPELDQIEDIGLIYESETESDTDTESECSYILQKELVSEPDFFENFGAIPSMSRLSMDESVEDDEKRKKSTVVYDSSADLGYFVDPLTGIREPSIIELPEPEPEPPAAEVEEEGEEEEDLMLPPDLEDDVTLAKMEDDTLDMWYQIEKPKGVHMDEEIDLEDIARLQYERQIYESTIEFLDELIAEIVAKCEYVDPNTIMRQSLDKIKLMEELNLKLYQLDVEQKTRFFLNRKTVEFFRRKKAYRSIIDDNPDTIKETLERYKESTALLDQLLGREQETNKEIARQKLDLEYEALEKEAEVKNCITSLEDMIKKALQRDGFEHLKAVVENQLRKMETARNEIADVRFVLLQRQHTLAALKEKSKAMENIGNGLSMRHHEHLQTVIMTLTKKIEDRNTELFKCRKRHCAEVHIMGHIKDKKHMLRTTVGKQEQELQELLTEKKNYREQLFQMKLSRSKIREDIKNISFQGGLIDKPALMYDYDETMTHLLKMKTKVEKMRQSHNELQHKITVLEGKCVYISNLVT